MSHTLRRISGTALALLAALTVYCTIQEDNGKPVDPGTPPPNVGGGGGGTDVDILPPGITVINRLSISSDSGHVKPGDTLTLQVRLLADTLKADTVAATVALVGKRIGVTKDKATGWLSSSEVTTDANGYAIVKFSSADSGYVDLIFKHNTLEAKSPILVTSIAPRNITISASPSVLAADGTSKSIITVQVKNEYNNPFVGDTMMFRTTAGIITAVGVTDADGKATAELTSERHNLTATVTALLKINEFFSRSITVEFSGVTVSAAANPTSIQPDGADVSTITATVRDAAGIPIVGERVLFSVPAADARGIYFLDCGSDSLRRSCPATSNSRGEASMRVVDVVPGARTIIAEASGARTQVSVTLSSETIKIYEKAGNTHIANHGTKTDFYLLYKKGDAATLIQYAKIYVSMTLGSMSDGTTPLVPPIVFDTILTTDANGYADFSISNPNFATKGTVYAKAECPVAPNFCAVPGVYSTDTYDVWFRASVASLIELKVTPSVISTNGGKAALTATAYDANGNRAGGVLIAFNMRSGPGGGEHIDPPVATTAADGTASVSLISGSVPSAYRGVEVIASNFSDPDINQVRDTSNIVRVTIAGPPRYIALSLDTVEATKDGAIYAIRVDALVSDVNGNPVADGTDVTFGVQVSGYTYYRKFPIFGFRIRDGVETTERIWVGTEHVPVYVTSEHFRQSRPYNPYPDFEDINGNGIPDRGRFVEPCDPMDPTADAETHIGLTVNPDACTSGVFADYNKTRTRDTEEPFVDKDPAYQSLYYEGPFTTPNLYQLDPIKYNMHQTYDIDVNRNRVADPNTVTLITRTVQTVDGVAANSLKYGQSSALHVHVVVTAEAQGHVTDPPFAPPARFLLPGVKEDGENRSAPPLSHWQYE